MNRSIPRNIGVDWNMRFPDVNQTPPRLTSGWRIALLAALLLGIGATIGHARFAAPAEGPVPFRCDRLPLDAEAMADLSRHLEGLARSLDPATARHRRGAAQLLALAAALDPQNADVPRWITTMHQGGRPPQPAADSTEHAVESVTRSLRWLDRSDAGQDARALAACLKDVLLLVDPDNVLLQLSSGDGERGHWKSWIPEVSAYEPEPKATVKEPQESPAPAPTETPSATPAPIIPRRSEIRAVVWQRQASNGVTRWLLQPADVRLDASRLPPASNAPSLTIISTAASAAYAETLRSITAPAFRKHGPTLAGWGFRISSKALEDSLVCGKAQFPEAALAVLTASALNGNQTDAIVLGRFDEQGGFRQAPLMWDQLRALGKANRQRLILPTDTEELVLSWLAWEKPEFFIHYEVMLASNLDEACRFAAEQPDEPSAAALKAFEQFCTDAMGRNLRTFIALPKVKRGLGEIVRQLPHHLSAKALLLQANNKRPILLHRLALCSELRRITEPMEWITGLEDPLKIPADRPKIGDVHDECRRNLDALEPYVSKQDDALLSASRTLDALRALDRAIAIKSRDDLAERLPRIQKAKDEFTTAHRTLIKLMRSAEPEAFR